ncbi:hypothetical protein [Ornithinimicrobium pratense]|uniref:Uncharacterized protein n=1 Tax=Ornithinimicrobium pratense TaxID=2593973 RepID=A0A5J6V7A7_9MICO|nr:hypothetical protein [Ornithinimicrobium pratense]QFG69719.1 hypothetical protein FY030_14320 [Ornithinimicrobium pratense]
MSQSASVDRVTWAGVAVTGVGEGHVDSELHRVRRRGRLDLDHAHRRLRVNRAVGIRDEHAVAPLDLVVALGVHGDVIKTSS